MFPTLHLNSRADATQGRIGENGERPLPVLQRREEEYKSMARILLVEDNEMNRDMLSRRLIRRGYEVILAQDGQEGLDAAQAQASDLILMDMSLPVMDGDRKSTRLNSSH